MCLEKLSPIGRLYRHSPLFRMQWQSFSVVLSENSIGAVWRARRRAQSAVIASEPLGDCPCKRYLRTRDLLFLALGSAANNEALSGL